MQIINAVIVISLVISFWLLIKLIDKFRPSGKKLFHFNWKLTAPKDGFTFGRLFLIALIVLLLLSFIILMGAIL